MAPNAFILDWTMDEYEQLKAALREAGFVFESDGDSDHIRVDVPFERAEAFAALCQQHLNAAVNYVDIQYPERKITVIVFRQAVHFITNQSQNDQVRAWAIEMGLPPEQADWATSF